MTKRLLSIILALTLVVLSVPAFAEESVDSSGESTTYDPTVYDYIELVDFSDGTYGTIKESDYLDVTLSNKAYGDANGSILYNFGNGAFDSIMSYSVGEIKALFNDTADRANAIVKLRYYSEDIGNQFTICFGKEGITGTNTGYSHATVEVKNFGWQEFSIPFTKIVGTDADWRHFRIDSTGWINNPSKFPEDAYDPYWTKGDAIYFDSLWFERVPQSKVVADAPAGDDVLVLDGMPKYSNNDTRKATATAGYTTNTRPGGAPSYTMVNITDANPKFRFDVKKDDGSLSADYADYKYFNIWVYSPRPQTGGLGILFNGTTTGKKTIGTSLDWTGWKLITVDVDSRLSSVTDKDASGRNTIGAVNKVQITAGDGYTTGIYKWDAAANNFSATVSATNKGFWNEWNNAGEFGIEGAWFSKEKPEGANVDPGSSTKYAKTTPITPNETDWVVYDIATEQPRDTGSKRFAYDSDNGHLYAGSSRTTSLMLGRNYFEITYASGAISKVKQVVSKPSGTDPIPSFYHNDPKTQAAYDARRRPISEGYTHVNLWLYSPGISYDQFGNYGEYVLSFQVFGAFDAEKGSTAIGDRVGVGIPVNWVGWKLVSIPLSGFSADVQAKLEAGIRRIEIVNNCYSTFHNDWKALGTNDITDAAIIANITPDCNDADETTNLSRPVDGDYDFGLTSDGVYHGDFNTFCEDVFVSTERLWFSKEAPAASFGEIRTQTLNNISVDDEKFEVTFPTKVGFINGEALEAPITELALDYASPLALGEKYEVIIPEFIVSTDGHIYEGKLKYTGKVVEYNCAVDSEAKTVSFDISNNWQTKYGDDITLIVAVYTDDAKQNLAYTELALCKVGETATIDYSTFAQYGSKMQIMLWDMGNAYPIIDPIGL